MALDIDLAAFFQEAFGHTDKTVGIEYDGMPFGAFFFLARGAVLPVFGGRDAQIADASAILERFDFGVSAQIAHDDDFIDASRHVPVL